MGTDLKSEKLRKIVLWINQRHIKRNESDKKAKLLVKELTLWGSSTMELKITKTDACACWHLTWLTLMKGRKSTGRLEGKSSSFLRKIFIFIISHQEIHLIAIIRRNLKNLDTSIREDTTWKRSGLNWSVIIWDQPQVDAISVTSQLWSREIEDCHILAEIATRDQL